MSDLQLEQNKKNLTLITGSARSGKSELAEALGHAYPHSVYYLATMEKWPDDSECLARIAKHRMRRPDSWLSFETPRRLHERISSLPAGPGLVIIDCLSLYVSNILIAEPDRADDPYKREASVKSAINQLLLSIGKRSDLDFIVVTNEVGWGVVPPVALARAYRDFLGEANQAFARDAGEVWLMVAGLKLRLK
jgi:adenosylcobinamide kinase/adenosylcobinamide-phosphate guanylyltransferase